MPDATLLVSGFCIFFGCILMSWGGKLPRRGDWLAGLGILSLLILMVLSWGEHLQWVVGWIWPKTEALSVQVGLFSDLIGSSVSIVATLIAAVVVANYWANYSGDSENAKRPERQFAAGVIGVAGVALSWLSATPWLAYVGIAITVIAGFISLAVAYDTEADAVVASRFIKEKAAGLLLAVFGTSALTSLGVPFLFAQSGAISEFGSFPTESHLFAATLMMAGLSLIIQPFPVLSSLVWPSSLPPSTRTTYSQLFPAWATFAILFRLEPSLRTVGVLPTMGWVALIGALLILIMGLIQKDWKLSLSTWTAASFAVAISALCFSDPVCATSLMICSSLAAVTMSLLGVQLEKGGGKKNKNPTDRNRAVWAKVGVFLSAATASGFLGFVSATGIMGWLIHIAAEPALLVATPIVLLLVTVLGWRLAWQIAALNDSVASSWFFVLSPFLLLLLPLSLFWVGSFSGGAISGDVNSIHWLASLGLGDVFGAQLKSADESAFITASWIHWGVLAFGVLAAWWCTARKQDLLLLLHTKSPTASRFIVGGYGAEFLLGHILSGVFYVGESLEKTVDRKLWGHWIPNGLKVAVEFISRQGARADYLASVRFSEGFRGAVSVPAKIIQLIHNGDVQWYLFLAIGSGTAIWIHFWKF